MTIEAEIHEQHQSSPLVELFTLDCTPIGGVIYRFTNHFAETGSVTFNGLTYTSLPIAATGYDLTTSGTQPRPTLTVSNVTSVLLNAVITLGDIVGCKVTRIRTHAKFLDAASFTQRNLFKYSEQFDNAAWSKGYVLITPNAVTGPTGFPNAETLGPSISGTTTSRALYQTYTTAVNGTFTLSVYAKLGTLASGGCALYLTDQTGVPNVRANFNLFTGAVPTPSVTTWVSGGATVTPLADGWYRLSITGTSNTAHTAIRGYLFLGSYASLPDTTGTIHIWGGQLNSGSTLLEYQETGLTHQPYADTTQYLGPDVFYIEQKSSHTKEAITWQLASSLDRLGTMLPRRQILKKDFPGAGASGGIR